MGTHRIKELPKFSHFTLLGWIMALLVVSPLVTGPVGIFLVNILFTCVLLSIIYLLSNEKRVVLVALCLAIPTMVIHWVNFFQEADLLFYLSSGFTLAFLSYTIIFLFRKVFQAEKLHTDLIFGALSIYFIIGLFWAVFYGLLEFHFPGSFLGITETGLSSMSHLHEFLYFSYVTLSTLGFGDIVPVNPEVRNLVVIEAILGQFYIATLVAGLIGLLIRNKE